MQRARFLDRLATAQAERPWLFLFFALAVSAGAFPLAARLHLDASLTALLPGDAPSVRDLERIGGRIGGLESLTVVLESRDLPAMQRFARALVPRLEALGPPLVRSVEWNVGPYEDFVGSHRELYASTDDLREVRDALRERLEWERMRANPLFVPLDEPEDPREVVRRIDARASAREGPSARFPGGYYVHPSGRLLALFVRSDVSGGGVRGLASLTSAVLREAEALRPTTFAPDLRIELAGPVIAQQEEHRALEKELVLATTVAVALVLAILLVFFRRLRALPAILLSLGVPTLVTFAFAALALGSLNTSTAFLGSIVVGNGVNPNVIWLARYFEERRAGRALPDAIATTHRSVLGATAAASLAAAIAYGSLTITDFRGFHDFGILGVFGMIACWLGALGILPAAIAAAERLRPLVPSSRERERRTFSETMSGFIHRAPGAVVGGSAALAVVGLALAAHAVANDPLEYDFRKLRSESRGATTAHRLNPLVSEIRGGAAIPESIAVVFDREEDLYRYRAALDARSARGGATFGGSRSIDDLLPREQPEKLTLLAEIRRLLLEFRPRVDEETRRAIDAHLPPEDLAPLGRDDLPEEVARPFEERDGTRGRILLVVRRSGVSIWDGRYLLGWARELRAIRLPDGTRPPLAGRAPVFADMIASIVRDGPRSIALSFGLTCALVMLAFRTLRERLLVLGALLLGVIGMAGAMALLHIKLNFLNFVAFPITFGNGVDYAVNVAKRHALERAVHPAGSVRATLAASGGAVTVCSLTTVVGYASLLVSSNLALRSFGLCMTISELTCLVAAVLTLPAALLLLERRAGGPSPRPS